ncbi:adenylate kinase-domain-containing protein [Chaetomium strumarium]|uniref:Adenylate kinase-domain-containing protein n=1 Tax=Chaetomium strumarium TaxID=1170767 RepID=A0AAJ0GWT5_9PEZI|nr:adenylate kinase-domain-containing protein [Chaetomium strumarium]
MATTCAGILGDPSPRPEPDLKQAVIVGMLGGPGSGKGTQCQMLSQIFELAHISIGDVLRQEINRPGSQYAGIIRENMMAGKVGPKEITISIVRDHMQRSLAEGTRAFILDGFPRNMEQCNYFEQIVGPVTLLLVLDCPESTMVERLTRSDRNRFDDTEDNIRRRIETFQNTTSEVIESFRRRNKLHNVNSDREPGLVRNQVEAILDGLVTKRAGMYNTYQSFISPRA